LSTETSGEHPVIQVRIAIILICVAVPSLLIACSDSREAKKNGEEPRRIVGKAHTDRVVEKTVQRDKEGIKPSTSEIRVSVYITRTGKKYHRAGCRYLSKSKISISLDEAKKWYTPCSVCNPPP
jgi:hypothetical protein